MKTKKKVNVLAFGDFLDTLKGPLAVSAIGGLTSLLGSSASNLSVPDTYVPNTKAGSVEELLDLYGQGAPQISTTNVGKSSLTGVAEGAAAGAAFGPWGAAIGGAAGGLANLATSLIGNKKIQRRNLLLQLEQTNNLDAARQALEEKNFNTQMSTIFANGGDLNVFAKGGNLSREEDYGSAKKPYPSVAKGDFAGGGRSYPIPTKADAIDALRLAGLHGRSDVRSKVYAKYPSLKKDEGGLLFAQGGDLQEQEENGVNTFATGGSHELNPNGGIPQGVDGEGTPNLVEQGEVKYDNYIFSNRLKVDKKHTFADMAKKYSRESKERPNDPISKRGLDTKMNALRGILELMKGNDFTSQLQESQPFAKGGALPPSLGQLLKWDKLLTPALTTPSYFDVPTVPNVINPSLSGPSILQKGSEIALRIREAPLQTFTPDNLPSDLSLASLRYAPAVGAGLATLTDTLGLTNRPDYTAAKRIGSLSVTPRMLGNYQKYTPMDKNYYTNELLSNAAAARAGLESSSGGNRAAYTSAVTGLNYGTGKSLGELARQSEEENIQRRQLVMTYNQGIDQYNAQQAALAQLTNNQYRAQAAQLAELADIMSKQTKMANLNNFLQTLGDIGGEETRLNIAKSNPALYDYLTRTGEVKYKGLVKRCGGKLKFK